jgi:hypothetical protein
MAVSFMIAVSSSLAAPLVGGLSPLLRTPLPRSDTAYRMSFADFWYAARVQTMTSEEKLGYLRRAGWIRVRGNQWHNRDGLVMPFGAACQFQLLADLEES